MDTRTPQQRRHIMQSVGTKNTGPEMRVRSLLHGLGYRYRLHVAALPGRPDIVFPGRRAAIFVHGCYWHGHGCEKGQPPKSRLDFWLPKLAANRARDRVKAAELKKLGWRVFVIWQCETRDSAALQLRLTAFLDGKRPASKKAVKVARSIR
jgi:DNA mismatch endonuclease (patch repair protein)